MSTNEFVTRRVSRMPIRLSAIAMAMTLTGTTLTLAQDAGVPFGADKQAFIDALADMEPVTLSIQSASTPGAPFSQPVEQYAAVLDEWSGGKIKLNITYGSAIISGNAAPAIADGRLFYGGVIASYDPSNFPATAGLVNISFLAKQSPIAGMLQAQGAMLEMAYGLPEVIEEQREQGIEPGLLLVPGVPNGLVCAQPRHTLAEFAGIQTRVGGAVHASQAEGLGMAGVSLAFNEVFEGLQRGIIDCSVMTMVTAKIAGVVPVAPYYSIALEQGFGSAATGTGFDLVTFEELPLAARQLVFDKQAIYLEQQLIGYWAEMVAGFQQLAEANGEVQQFDAEATAKLAEINEGLLAAARESSWWDDPNAVVDRMIETNSKWAEIIEELGYNDVDQGYLGFQDWYSAEAVDLKPFTDRIYSEILLPHRPQ